MLAFGPNPLETGGAASAACGRAVAALVARAIAERRPVVGLYDSPGLPIEDGLAALAAWTEAARGQAEAAGVIPQVAIVLGACAGPLAVSAALADLRVMAESAAALYLSGPEIVTALAGEAVSAETLGGARVHGRDSGLADVTAPGELEALLETRRLLGFLPAAAGAPLPRRETADAAERSEPALERLAADGEACDMKAVIGALVDEGDVLELSPAHAPNVITALARFAGEPVGILANQPRVLGGCLDAAGCSKAMRLARLCDAFGLALVTLVDTPGFMPRASEERRGVALEAAALLAARARARRPGVTIVLGRAHGAALALLCSGNGPRYAWPGAEIAALAPAAALERAGQVPDPPALAAWRAAEASAEAARARALVDALIAPAETRAAIVRALAGGPPRSPGPPPAGERRPGP